MNRFPRAVITALILTEFTKFVSLEQHFAAPTSRPSCWVLTSSCMYYSSKEKTPVPNKEPQIRETVCMLMLREELFLQSYGRLSRNTGQFYRASVQVKKKNCNHNFDFSTPSLLLLHYSKITRSTEHCSFTSAAVAQM